MKKNHFGSVFKKVVCFLMVAMWFFGIYQYLFHKPPADPYTEVWVESEKWRLWLRNATRVEGMEYLNGINERYLNPDEKVVTDDPGMRRLAEEHFRQAREKAARGCFEIDSPLFKSRRGLPVEISPLLLSGMKEKGGLVYSVKGFCQELRRDDWEIAAIVAECGGTRYELSTWRRRRCVDGLANMALCCDYHCCFNLVFKADGSARLTWY